MRRILTILFTVHCSLLTFAQDKVLSELVVTATGTQHTLKDVPVQTEVISRKMLDSFGGKSLEEILGSLTASFAFNEGDMGSQMQLGGLGNNYILILVDGKRLHGDVGGENDLGLIDPQNIERIEIVKGAQSALYGSDAMAGVINIITRKHRDNGVLLENTTRYGSYNDLRQHNTLAFNLTPQTGHRQWSLGSQTNFQLQHTDGWQNTAREWAEGMVLTDSRNKTVNPYTNWQVAERLTYTPLKNLELYADGSYYIKHINRPQDGKHPSCDVYTYDLRYNNASASFGGKWEIKPPYPPRGNKDTKSGEQPPYPPRGNKDTKNGEQPPYPPRGNKDTKNGEQPSYSPSGVGGAGSGVVTFDVDWNKHAYFYDYTARTYEYVLLRGEEYGDLDGEWYSVPMYRGQSKLQSDQQRLMAQAKGVFYLPGENTLNAGMEYRYDYLNAPERTENGSASDWTTAAYVQDEWNLLHWFNLTAGARLVGNENYGLRFTPKVSAMFSLGDFRLRLGWSQGFKSPLVKELYYRYLHVMGSSTFFNIGNTDLRPQTSNYYSTNVEYRGSRLMCSVSPYINRLDHMIALVNVPVGEIPAGITTAYLGDGSGNVQARMYRNMEDARTWGVDVNISYRLLSELTLTGAYSYLDTEAHLYNTSSAKVQTVTIDGMAHHKWSASATYNHTFSTRYRLGVNLSTRGSSKRYYQNNGNGAPYQIWRINTTHDLGKRNKVLAYRLELGVDNIFNHVDRTMHPYHLGTTSAGTTVYGTFGIKFNQGKRLKTNNLTTKSKQNDEED